MVHRLESYCSRTLVTAFVLAAAFVGRAPTADAANTVVTLNFEGVGDDTLVGSYYGNYGIFFGTSAISAVSIDAGGAYDIANLPSPSTAFWFPDRLDQSQYFITVRGGFAAMSFQYTCPLDYTVTIYAGVDMTGSVLGSATLQGAGHCGVGPPRSDCVWRSVTVPFAGVAKSAGFSSDFGPVWVDDVVLELLPRVPTHAPTKAPTKPPSKPPTRVPTQAPTNVPTNAPTNDPTRVPTNVPTVLPTKVPTHEPTSVPTKAPTKRPTRFPTRAPRKMCRQKGRKANKGCRRNKRKGAGIM